MDGRLYAAFLKIRDTAEDIRKSIVQIQSMPAWPDFLSQAAVLLLQYQNLLDQLSNEVILNHHILQPKAIPNNNHLLIPNLLHTKPLPEVEQKEEELWKQYEALFPTRQFSYADKLEHLQERRNEYNKIITELEEHYEKAKASFKSASTVAPEPTYPIAPVTVADLAEAINSGNGLKLPEPVVAPVVAPAPSSSAPIAGTAPRAATGAPGAGVPGVPGTALPQGGVATAGGSVMLPTGAGAGNAAANLELQRRMQQQRVATAAAAAAAGVATQAGGAGPTGTPLVSAPGQVGASYVRTTGAGGAPTAQQFYNASGLTPQQLQAHMKQQQMLQQQQQQQQQLQPHPDQQQYAGYVNRTATGQPLNPATAPQPPIATNAAPQVPAGRGAKRKAPAPATAPPPTAAQQQQQQQQANLMAVDPQTMHLQQELAKRQKQHQQTQRMMQQVASGAMGYVAQNQPQGAQQMPGQQPGQSIGVGVGGQPTVIRPGGGAVPQGMRVAMPQGAPGAAWHPGAGELGQQPNPNVAAGPTYGLMPANQQQPNQQQQQRRS